MYRRPLFLFLRGGGRLYTGYDSIGEKDQNDRNAIKLFTTPVKSRKGKQKNIYTGIIKTFVGLRSHSTFINFASVYVSKLTEYIKEKMGTRPSLFDSC